MFEIIKDKNGNVLKEPEKTYVIEMADHQMFEGDTMQDMVAAYIDRTYYDVEAQETALLMRMDSAKQTGLTIVTMDEMVGIDSDVIMYDERIGKIPYSYTDPQPDYEIEPDSALIRVECDETFILSLVKLEWIILWVKTEEDYKNLAMISDVDQMIEDALVPFKGIRMDIPLHRRMEE